ncbi:hypothetical protein NY78_3996 [Desulfovibrio sp. TomC]|nr:hypothetical protein NY78_3996 [Desulfovibrio sp. TomC]
MAFTPHFNATPQNVSSTHTLCNALKLHDLNKVTRTCQAGMFLAYNCAKIWRDCAKSEYIGGRRNGAMRFVFWRTPHGLPGQTRTH